MKAFVKVDPWRIIEENFHTENQLNSESIFSIGNGKMGQRANFEEDYSGESLSGNYVAGIYYPDKTRVGWWKNGYPEYFAKVLNAVEWIGLHIKIDGEVLDLNTCEFTDFERILDMKRGVLERRFKVKTKNGQSLSVEAFRFYSMLDDEVSTLSYTIKSNDFKGNIEIESYLNFDVRNQDSNYEENFWIPLESENNETFAFVKAKTKKTNFVVECGMSNFLFKNEEAIKDPAEPTIKGQKISHKYQVDIAPGETLRLVKYVSIVSSFYYDEAELNAKCAKNVEGAIQKGFSKLLEEQAGYWRNNWANNDILIEGDDSAQQAMRFNIFQLNQTYTGKDDRLNIGPKGFTGEKYGGSTYWDTEAYCLPFYLATAPEKVAHSLLLYRYKQLGKAIENAGKLGFNHGAALYPMVTMNGEECHNEWEITFEEIHRNGAIAYAIFDYVRYTGDADYLISHGLEVLISISRFWEQRIHFSQEKQQYVMHGVTGPNEYENNVNNNWYTLYIARWCLYYTLKTMAETTEKEPGEIQALFQKMGFDFDKEAGKWVDIIEKLYLPEDEKRGIFLQQDGFLDKELIPVSDLDSKHLPLVHNWSWDRILRSCYIKQADVLQGLYFFEEDFTKEEIERNFDFYEPLTVHESSLSPCVHSILAASINRPEKAYEMFMQTARLDLDDFNSDSKDGCHITSMAGTWLAFVKGFGGMRIQENKLSFAPFLPKKWKAYAFTIGFRKTRFTVRVSKESVEITKDGGAIDEILLFGEKQQLKAGKNVFNIPKLVA